jgi:hypothetical protein
LTGARQPTDAESGWPLSQSAASAPPLELERVSGEEIAALGARLRQLTAGAPHRQAVAQRLVEELYSSLQAEGQGEPACALVRCFQTCPYARLPPEYQHAADALLADIPSHRNMRCLTLLATRGVRTVWNDVATSTHHQSIPLPSVEVVRRAPMIARWLDQMGVALERVVAVSDALDLVAEDGAELNVFHIAQAQGSPFIPAQQQFVEPYGVRSVIGMGGVLPDGELFAMVLFTKVPVSRETALLFRPLAVALGETFKPLPSSRTFPPLAG